MNVNEVLKKRYGGDRFNPVAGQSQMSFQEWMDRHPSLQGAKKGVAYDRYKSATSEAGGRQYLQGAPSIDGPVKPPEMFDKMAEHKGFAEGRPPSGMAAQMGGPDQPPNMLPEPSGARRAGDGIKSVARNNRSKKMLGAATRRGMGGQEGGRPSPKKGAQPKQTRGNVQAQHPVVGRSDNKKIPASSGNKKMVNYPAKDKMKRGGIRGNK